MPDKADYVVRSLASLVGGKVVAVGKENDGEFYVPFIKVVGSDGLVIRVLIYADDEGNDIGSVRVDHSSEFHFEDDEDEE